MNTPKTIEQRVEEAEKHLDDFYGDGFGHFNVGAKTSHVADYIRQALSEQDRISRESAREEIIKLILKKAREIDYADRNELDELVEHLQTNKE